MRVVLVLLIFVVRLVACTYITFSENDKLQNMEKNRAKSEFYDKYLGKPKKFHRSLQTSLKDIVTEKQRKRCEACRESIRCKTQRKCDLCIRLCKDMEETTLPPATLAPLLGSIQFYMSEENAATEPSLGEVAPFERLNRYYTVGAFGPGPKQNLLMRLLNLPQKDNVEKLVVLAKPEGGIDDPDHPIIIDTANVFQDEEYNMEIDPEVHTLHGSRILRQMDMDLTSKIDRELNIAAQKKKKTSGNLHLTNQEVDEIIGKTMSTFTPSHQPKLSEEMEERDSGINIVGLPHITTKRSISRWESSNNLKEPVLGLRSFFESDSESETLSPQVESNHIQVENASDISKNDQLSTETNLKQEIQLDDDAQRAQNISSYKGDSHLAKDICTDTVLNAKLDFDENLAELEPAPPTYIGDDLQSKQSEIKHTTESLNENLFTTSTPQTVSQRPTMQNTLEMLSVTIASKRKPESASMVLGNVADHQEQQPPQQQTNFAPDIEYKDAPIGDVDFQYEDPFDDRDYDVEEDVVLMLTPPPTNRKSENNHISFETNMNLPNNNSSMHDNNSSDPAVGSWMTDEWDKAKSWWHTHVGMEEPHNSTESVENRELHENETNENSRQTESKSHLINANHFTMILKSLEKKVENIADLVEKTCGKHHSAEETVGLEAPTFIKKKQEEKTAIKESTAEANNKQRAMAGNQIQIIEMPDDQTLNEETTTTVALTEDVNPSTNIKTNRQPSVLDIALENLHKGTDLLINKAVDIAEKLQEGANIPKLAQDKPLSQTKEDIVGSPNMNRGWFSTDDTTVACSNEDAGEFIAKPPPETPETNKDIEKQNTTTEFSKETEQSINEKSQNKNASLESRLASKHDEISTDTSAQTKSEENVACSSEDSNEYVSKKKHAGSEKPRTAEEQQLQSEQKIKHIEKQEQIQEENKAANETNHKFNATKPSNEETVACSQELDEYVGNAEEQNAKELPESESNLNVSSTKAKIKEDGKNKTDEEVAKQEIAGHIENKTDTDSEVAEQKSPKISENKEEVGCSEELHEDYVGRINNEENEDNKNLSQSPVQKDENSLQNPVLPNHEQLPRRFHLDKMLQRENGLQNVREGRIRNPQNFPTLFNLNRSIPSLGRQTKVDTPTDHQSASNIPSDNHRLASESDIPEITQNVRPLHGNKLFGLGSRRANKDTPIHRHSGSNIPSDTHRLASEPDTPEITQNVRPLPASNRFTLGSRGLMKNLQSEMAKSHENAASQLVQPVHQRHQLNLLPIGNVPPLHKDAQVLNLAAPGQQHSDKALLPPLNQRFAEHEQVGSDGFHVHRPKNLENWPGLPNKDEILGAKQNVVAANNTDREISSKNPFTVFGKVVPQFNSTELSLHNIPSNKIYFVGTGMQLPLNMKKHDDGSYQLSVDIDKLCNNCNGKSCSKNSENENVGTAKDEHLEDEVVGLPSPKAENNESKVIQSDTISSKASKLEQQSASQEQQSDDELMSEKTDITKTKASKFRSKRVFNTRNITHFENNQTKSQHLSEQNQIYLSTTQPPFKYQQLFDSDFSDKRRHSEISKRSPKLDLDFMLKSDLTAKEGNHQRKDEIPMPNTLQINDLGKSLKKIDNNMKHYFDRRQKLEEHYRERNKQDLEKPDVKKDVVKRRVTLINNVLTWMKSIAVQDAQT